MVSLARQQFLAVAKNEEFGIINFVAIYYEKSASKSASLWKKNNNSEKKFTESEQYKDAESFKINCEFDESSFINLLLHFIFHTS